jgi:hypothetical protein
MVVDKKCDLSNPVIINLLDEQKVFFSNLVGLLLKYDKLGDKTKELRKNSVRREITYNPYKYIRAQSFIRPTTNSNQVVFNNNGNNNNMPPKDQPKPDIIAYPVDEKDVMINNKLNNIVRNINDNRVNKVDHQNSLSSNNVNNIGNLRDLNNPNQYYDIPSYNQIVSNNDHMGHNNTNHHTNNHNHQNVQHMNNQFNNMNINHYQRQDSKFGYNDYINSQIGDNNQDNNKQPFNNNNNNQVNRKDMIDDIFKDL